VQLPSIELLPICALWSDLLHTLNTYKILSTWPRSAKSWKPFLQ
jgi:hypothetical protein